MPALPVIAPAGSEPVLLGSAMLGEVAGVAADGIEAAMQRMSRAEATFVPATAYPDLHSKRHEAFRKLQASARALSDI